MSIIDDFPFPAFKPKAQDLVNTMADLYEPYEAILFTQRYGINPNTLPKGLSPIELWTELLETLARTGEVRTVVKAARDQFPNNKIVVNFLDELLAEEPVRAAPVVPKPARGEGLPTADGPRFTPPGNLEVAIDDRASRFWGVGAGMPILILVGAILLRVSGIDRWLVLGWIALPIAILTVLRFYYCSIDLSRDGIYGDRDDPPPAQKARRLAFAGVLLTIFSIAASGLVLHSIGG